MSDVIETLDKNIKTIEMLEKEYAKRATPRMKYASIRSALNNAIISLKKTKDRYSEEPQECKWTKGINSVETCWGDIDIKIFNQFKRQGAKFCPYCGRKIKVI